MKRKMLMVMLAACPVLSGCSSGKDAGPARGTSEESEAFVNNEVEWNRESVQMNI